MKTEEIIGIFNEFDHSSAFESFEGFVSGHINETFLIKTVQKPYFVLQRINNNVFKDVAGLVENKVRISNHLHKKLALVSYEERKRRVVTYISTKTGNYYLIDNSGNYWTLMYFIDNSKTIEVVKSEAVAYEGGKLFGEFLSLTSDFDVRELVEVIPDFHSMKHRYKQFEDAYEMASPEALIKAKSCTDLIEELRGEMHQLQLLLDEGVLSLRVTHNDTKISNALFDNENKGLCVIDLDTVMPGIIHYDFGDAIRSICNQAAEDEKDLDLVEFNVQYFAAYYRGFLEKIGDSISSKEIEFLPLGAKSMIFIMGLRFLTDYFNGNVYYKTKYQEHNLDRAKNQFKLLQSFSDSLDVCKRLTSKETVEI